MTTATKPVAETAHDTFPINGTDYIEFWVGNAKQSQLFYRAAFGFKLVAYRGPETGVRDRASYLLEQGKIRLILTTPMGPEGEIAAHIAKHGDGVRDMAFWVDDCRDAYAKAIERGAVSVQEPTVLKDEHGEIVVAGIRTYGDTIHSIVERRNYKGLFMPGFIAADSPFQPEPVGLKYVDHCVGNVELGKMNHWVQFYSDVLGFYNLLSFDDKTISTEYSALMSKVMSNGNGRIKFPINEPAQGKKKSQIEEYLDFYRGPGVQHIAVATDDIIRTVRALKSRGVEFLTIPRTYYETVLDRVGKIDEDIAPLAELGILVDRDDEGYLLQIFTKPVQDRPTLFFEIIQRKGAKSFGAGNFKALFESIEREQAKRGNL
ncbi:4-hydroxyphenylpyruvate dioxygenase [Pseudogemmatithrix spongiicola]|uniref:4-hydroxyphenylpyruvate dioxygenase n=1 Tax=Pseudogemmatithrix spongiicola TaxID=3062599 RepID=A0AA49K124_9BACT|nr:4-hydroxyphenylpyruvate dioxygenase [Gemmatimonadaceae bacterium 'strain 138']WKW15529.1 4-hydroxyphenylpyruvate dioxygenase [Gemmatimonadaceae bacterium 'strain 318']